METAEREGVRVGTAAERLVVVKTRLKPRPVELRQLFPSTNATSSGSAKVMSTHCRHIVSHREISHIVKGSLTLYRAAPCRAASTTWMVALSPTLTVELAGSGTCGRQKVPSYASLVGPVTWKTGSMGCDMLRGSLPKPMLM